MKSNSDSVRPSIAKVASTIRRIRSLRTTVPPQLFNEIVHAAKRYAEDLAAGKASELDEEAFGRYMYSADIPDPDLLIRPGGEKRISNFLLWQCAYSEFYFTDVLWPDFSTDELDKAIAEFQSRDRRYGGVKTP